MATAQATIDYILDQLSAVPEVWTRKMFGEYALYAGSKVVGLVCDDTLFVKITEVGKEFLGGDYQEGFPYPGAKAALQITDEQLEDRAWLTSLIALTAEQLPLPKPKKKKATTQRHR